MRTDFVFQAALRLLGFDGGKVVRHVPRKLTSPSLPSWLMENGPKELELLFRAIVYHPAAPILIADNDRNTREASAGAGKLLGLPREKIIGRQMDDFAPPDFKPQISQLWQAFLERGEQEGTLRLVGSDGSSARSGIHGQRECVAGTPCPGAARQERIRGNRATIAGRHSVMGAGLCALLTGYGGTCWPPGIRERSAFTAIRADEAIGQHVSFLYPGEDTLRGSSCRKNLTRTAAEGHMGTEGWQIQKGRVAILGQRHYHGAQRRKRGIAGLCQSSARL